jgi:hypothetical protein
VNDRIRRQGRLLDPKRQVPAQPREGSHEHDGSVPTLARGRLTFVVSE